MKRTFVSSACFILIVSLLMSGAGSEADSLGVRPQVPTGPAEQVTLELVGQIGGDTNAVVVQGNYAYVGVGPRLVILDVSNPANLTLVGQSGVLPGIVEGVVVAGNYAYVATGTDGGLRIINVSDLAAPSEVGFCNTPGSAEEVAVAGDYAYVADRSEGLRIINISDPAAPSEAGSYHTPASAYDVAIAEDYAYVVAGWRLHIINVSNPAAPTQASFYVTTGTANGVDVAESYAYVSTSAGLHVLNVSNPANPSEVGFLDPTPPFGSFGDVYVSGNTAYLADYWQPYDELEELSSSGLAVVDVTNPADPNLIGGCSTKGWVRSVYASGDTAYVADGATGLRVIDVSHPASPSEVAFYNPVGHAVDVHIPSEAPTNASLRLSPDTDLDRDAEPLSAGYVYVAEGWWVKGCGLRVVDASDHAHPREVAFYDTPVIGQGTSLYVSGNTAYIGAGRYYGWGYLSVIDVSDPAQPSQLGSHSGGWPNRLVVRGDVAYTADAADYFGTGGGCLSTVDVSDPTSPRGLGRAGPPPGDCWDVYVSGHTAYLTCTPSPWWDEDEDGTYDDLMVIDVSDPAHLTQVGSCDLGVGHVAYGVHVAGPYAYVAGDGFRVIDISDPTAPHEVGYCPEGRGRDVYIPEQTSAALAAGSGPEGDVGPASEQASGFYAYVANGAGLQVIDIGNSTSPSVVGSYDTPGSARAVHVLGDYAYVADEAGGLVVLRVQKPTPTPRTVVAVRAAASPTLDGDLSEWAAIPETILSQGTARWYDYGGGPPPTWQDASLVLQAAWDNDHLYFGLHANDDVLVRDSGDYIWKDDEIEIWVDGNKDGLTHSAVYDHQYTFNADGKVTDKGKEPSGLDVAMQTVPGGWNVEVAVPRSHLPPGTLVEGGEIGFTFGYRDDDDGGNWDIRLLWEGDQWNNTTAVHYGTLLLGGLPPTPTPTATATPTSTPTATPTSTATPTETPTPTPTGQPDLSASTKSAWPEVVHYFQEVAYTITLRNNGNAPAAVSLTDEPPLPYKAGSAVGGIWWDDVAGAIKWQGTLAVGESRVFMFTMHGPQPIIPHDTIYINEVTIDDSVHPPFVRSASVLANPWPTPTPTPTATRTPTETPTPTATLTPTAHLHYLPLVLR